MAPEIDTATQPDHTDTPTEQPVKKTPPKRTRRKAVAVAADPASSPAPNDAAQLTPEAITEPALEPSAQPAPEVGSAPKVPAKRRRSTTDSPAGRRARSAAKTSDRAGERPDATSPADDAAADEAGDRDTPAFSAAATVTAAQPAFVAPSFGLLFQAPAVVPEVSAPAAARSADDADTAGDADETSVESPAADDADADASPRRRRRGGRGRRSRAGDGATPEGGEDTRSDRPEGPDGEAEQDRTGEPAEDDGEDASASSRRRRRRRRGSTAGESEDAPGVVTKVRETRRDNNEVTGVKGSTRLEAKKQRRREGREAGRRRTVITEAEFLARRESVERVMLVRQIGDRTQIGVLEDGVLVEHYVSRDSTVSMAGNIYLGRVQNVLPSMEAAFVDIGKGRNAVLYAGEVNWDAAGLDSNQPKRIENALSSGENVLVQVTKDPIGHKGARLTSQISLPGRYLVYVPDSSMTGISRKLPDTERSRLKGILRDVLPETAGVIVRTAAEGASEEELRGDVERLTSTWDAIKAKAEAKAGKGRSGAAPLLLHGEPDLTVRVIRDIFNEDFSSLIVSGDAAYAQVNDYVNNVAPDLAPRIQQWSRDNDLFSTHRVHEQIAKAMDRKVWLPSGGSLVIDRTEAMTVIDVNTGKFVGSGGNLEETVTKNNLEAAEEIVRQLRLRDIGGIIVIDFIDMVLESNRDLVVRRLLECLGRDRTKHQVAEVTSLGLVQMTRKRVGSGLLEVFGEPCDHCKGRGLIVHAEPVERPAASTDEPSGTGSARQRGRRTRTEPAAAPAAAGPVGGPTPAQIAAAAHAAAVKSAVQPGEGDGADQDTGAGYLDADGAVIGEPVEVGEPVDTSDAALGDGSEPQDSDRSQTAVEPTEQPAQMPFDAPVGEPSEPSTDVSAAGAPRRGGRRRRGRVVAPAGPPRPAGQGPDN